MSRFEFLLHSITTSWLLIGVDNMAEMIQMTEEEIVAFSYKHRDKIGVRSGRLLTTGVAGKDAAGKIYVDAVCDCGNEVCVDYYCIKSGHTQSCGCFQRDRASETKFMDLSGKTFWYYYVESKYGKDKHGNTLYNCICRCGNRRVVLGYNLASGTSKSCGCYSKQRKHERLKDLTGQTFNNLYVIRFYGYGEDGRKTLWLCRCVCGAECVVAGSNLKNGHTKSCGCLISVGEEQIREFLDNHEIKYVRQKRFCDCKDQKPLPFDFYLPQYNIAIEYDGMYHYKNVRGKQDDYNKMKYHDQIKTQYCIDNNIQLIRIPYWERHNIKSILEQSINNDAEEVNSSSVDLSA